MHAQQLPDLPETSYVVALLPIGVPDEEPKLVPRLSSSAIALPTNVSAPAFKSVLQNVSEQEPSRRKRS